MIISLTDPGCPEPVAAYPGIWTGHPCHAGAWHPFWPCIEWGLPSCLVTQTLVSSYLTFSPLPRLTARRCLFCGTFL